VFGRRQSDTALDTIETLIGPTANIVGDLKSDGGVRIGGVLEGSLATAGNLAVEDSAQILGDITAHNASIAGIVKGNITANRVEVLSTGQVWGDISANSFLLDDGGFIEGHVHMQEEADGLAWSEAQTMETGLERESP
jgi:cytoskeletal protein CcmA (bactofilin family)